ncbi:MAG: hypothetical protein WBF33_31630 [Candidatus Nitrosopolaris sp.]|jgi:uncharacterized membrane protein YkoI
MNTTGFRKRNVLIVTALILSVGVSTWTTEYIQYVGAQTKSNITTGMMGGNKLKTTIGASGTNITGSVSLAHLIAKTLASEVNVTLVNATTIAEKTVGSNAHAVSARLAVVHGFLVYRALVVDSNYDFHTVVVDAGNGNVLSSAPLSIANNGMMSGSTQSFSSRPGSGSSDTGITSGHASNTTSVNKGSSNTLGLKGPTQSFSSRPGSGIKPPSLVR